MFPDRCPVCGKPATTEGTIPAIPRVDRIQARSMYGGSFPSARVVSSARSMPRGGSVSRISIPTCDVHALSFEEMARIRTPVSLCNGILILVTLLLTPFTLLAIVSGIAVNPSLVFALLIAGIMAIVTYYLSSPTPLERAVHVFDIDSASGHMVLRILNDRYADEIIQLNPMTAKRVHSR